MTFPKESDTVIKAAGSKWLAQAKTRLDREKEKQSKENDVLEKAEENEDVENRDDDADDEEEQY